MSTIEELEAKISRRPDPPRPDCSAARQPNGAWWALGLALGMANAVRHRAQGYRTPRDFGGEDLGRNVDYALNVVGLWLRKGDVDVRGKRILEVGPGPDLGTGAVLLHLGAASYTAADLFPLATGVGDGYYDQLGERLGQPVNRDRLDYVVTNYPAMAGVDGPFDLMVSMAALEHFDDIPATFGRLAELLAPGGVMVHHVDGMAHMRGVRERDPLNMLRYPRSIYRGMGFPGIPNRLRASDFVQAAEAAGLQARVIPSVVAPASYVEKIRPGLAAPYRDRDVEDLATLTFTLVLTH